jgi:hypothetical protein
MIFSENDKEYFLKVEPLISPEELGGGLWLVMAGVDTIPPHIALISDGLYYSVSAKKVDTGTPLQNFLKAISRKTIPTLFVAIKSPAPALPMREGEVKVGKSLLMGGLKGDFESYPTLGNGDHSCLWPVRDFFAKSYSEKYGKGEFVFELLKMAQEDNLIVECRSLFTSSSRSTLPKYSHLEIREKINSILKVDE